MRRGPAWWLNRLLIAGVVLYLAWTGYQRFFGAATKRSAAAALSFYRAAVEREDFEAQFAVADPDQHREILEQATFFCAVRHSEDRVVGHLRKVFGRHGLSFEPSCRISNVWKIRNRDGFYRELMEHGFQWHLSRGELPGLRPSELPRGALDRVVVNGDEAFGLVVVAGRAVPVRVVKRGSFWRVAAEGTVPYFFRLWVEVSRDVAAVAGNLDRLSDSRAASSRARRDISDRGERERMAEVDESMAERAEMEEEALRRRRLRDGWRPYEGVLGGEWFEEKMREL